MQKADDILTYFAKHTRQGRHYDCVLKKLSKAAVDGLEAIKEKERRSCTVRMPDLSKVNNENVLHPHCANDSRPMDMSSGSEIELESIRPTSVASHSQIGARKTWKSANDGSAREVGNDNARSHRIEPSSTSTEFTSNSLLGMAHYFDNLNESADLEDLSFDFRTDDFIDVQNGEDLWDLNLSATENIEGLWDLNWSGSLI